ncbi:MAG: hypothetical protein WA952_13745, partial [Lewinella sp.]
MVGKKLKQFGSSKGWYLGANSVFGIEGGYLVNVFQSARTDNPSSKSIRVETDPIVGEAQEMVRGKLEAGKKALGYDSIAILDSSITVTITETWRSTTPEKLRDILATVLALCNEAGIPSHLARYAGEVRHPYVVDGVGT